MSGIKYCQLAKGEEIPDEFCVVRDVDGEPSEYMFYVPETENAKLRELVDALMGCGTRYHTMSGACPMFDANAKDCCKAEEIARELGVKVDG